MILYVRQPGWDLNGKYGFIFLLIKQLPVTVKLEHKASVLENKERRTPARR
jgi:hypothetical protein